MEFGLLGPLAISHEGSPITLTKAVPRATLAVLLLHHGHPVAVERIIDVVWSEADGPPLTARSMVQRSVNSLRELFRVDPETTLRTRPGGYELTCREGALDLRRFEDLVDQADGCGSLREMAAVLREALRLWRGDPLSDVTNRGLESFKTGLTERRLTVVERCIELELQLGRHQEIVAELQSWTDTHPFRESMLALLMLALHRGGRTTDALAAYADFRARLAEEVGTDPGTAVRMLHERILNNDHTLAAPVQRGVDTAIPQTATDHADTPSQPAWVVPRQLPAGPRWLVGRDEQLAQLGQALAARETGQMAGAGTPVVVVVDGMAGIGKTALALTFAHQVSDRFPDGQLYLNLRGFGPADTPMATGEAVRTCLDALAVAVDDIPTSLQAQAGLYRSLIANRRMLVVLDNAADAEQVRPLLPASPASMVIITSRRRLESLVATDGAIPLALEVLNAAQAYALLEAGMGAARLAAEPDEVDELIARCAGLPLALRIVLARALTRPGFALAALVSTLRAAQDRLGSFDGGDPVTNLRVVFSWSYRDLPADTAWVFRSLAVHPGPEMSESSTASTSGLSRPATRAALAELVQLHLLQERAPGRFSLHDLIRLYAVDHLHGDGDEVIGRARQRLADHYLHSAHRAAMLLYPSRDPITIAAPLPGVCLDEFAGELEARAWFGTEHAVLLAVLHDAARHGLHAHAWQIPWSMVDYLDWGGHWRDYIATQQIALDASAALGDLNGQIRAHRGLGRAHLRLGDIETARGFLTRSLQLSRQSNDPLGEAQTHLILAWMHEQDSDFRSALGHAEQALEGMRAGHDGRGVANALNTVGWYHTLLGQHSTALRYCGQALEQHEQLDDPQGHADTWDSLGHAHRGLQDLPQAITCYTRAVELYRTIQHGYDEATTQASLAETLLLSGDKDRARAAWEHALTLLAPLDPDEADAIRSRLTAL
ncbi:BTAD domain-containing putative transcriptional regulator [Lentzea sp. NPDC060358]|uniref:AfsR/SARP family transcriptional regulator n=1 Tax=Lentzea sp. NPDC060358 TaxID=3347103 RepID=UPI00365CE6E3